jgi:hypothetical protein
LAVVTSAHGHAAMLHRGAFGPASRAVELALTFAERATLALMACRSVLNS